MAPLPSISEVLNKTLQPVTANVLARMDDRDCAICYDAPVKPNKLSCQCKHVYCEDCIRTALTRSDRCPMCNKYILVSLQDYRKHLLQDTGSRFFVCVDEMIAKLGDFFGNAASLFQVAVNGLANILPQTALHGFAHKELFSTSTPYDIPLLHGRSAMYQDSVHPSP